MSSKFLTPNYKGWERMWKVIERLYGDRACYNKNSGESWQYMGTFAGQHEFRHRDLHGFPQSNLRRGDGRVYENIPEEPGDYDLIDASSQQTNDQPPRNNKAFDFDAYNGIRRR